MRPQASGGVRRRRCPGSRLQTPCAPSARAVRPCGELPFFFFTFSLDGVAFQRARVYLVGASHWGRRGAATGRGGGRGEEGGRGGGGGRGHGSVPPFLTLSLIWEMPCGNASWSRACSWGQLYMRRRSRASWGRASASRRYAAPVTKTSPRLFQVSSGLSAPRLRPSPHEFVKVRFWLCALRGAKRGGGRGASEAVGQKCENR